MNTEQTPGFTAEHSLNSSRTRYHAAGTRFVAGKAAIEPQRSASDEFCDDNERQYREHLDAYGYAVLNGEWRTAMRELWFVNHLAGVQRESC